jgi:predicted DCC family thiol-disulfide oxidoreductase YuxK
MREPVLLYDGDCGFCSETVQFILRHERRQTLRFAPLQGAFGAAVLVRHPTLRGQDSVVWLEPSHAGTPELVLIRSDAVLRVSGYLGGLWRVAVAARVIPRSWRDACYDFVARRRHRIPGLSSSCLRPDAANEDRFIP